MKSNNKTAVWLVVLAVVVTGQWLIHRNMAGSTAVVPADADITAAAESRESSEDFYYTCGMHPDIHESEPGNCPICEMKLVKKSVSGAGNPSQVAIDPVTVQNMGVRSVAVEKRSFNKIIRAAGIITYDERRIETISSKVSGWVENIHADFTGMTVRKGDPLLTLYSPELVSTQEDYLQALKYNSGMAQASFAFAEKQSDELLKSSEKRLKLWDVSDDQIRELKESGIVQKSLTISSPVSGILIHREVDPGSRIGKDMHLFRIADITKVWAVADIYEFEAPFVKVGQDVEMSLSYHPGETFTGKVAHVYPYLNNKTRTVRIRAEFDNPGQKLKPDMYNEMRVNAAGDDVIAVPVSAVIRSGQRNVVVIDLGEGKFEPREVILGREFGDYYEISDGLDAGEAVVTSAQFLIDSESRMREAQMKMTDAEMVQEKVKEVVTLIGSGEMKYTCPMPEDMVFASAAGGCEECGMKLKEMNADEKAQLERLLKNHETERFDSFEDYKRARESGEEPSHEAEAHDEHAGHQHSETAHEHAEHQHQVQQPQDRPDFPAMDYQSVVIFGSGESTHYCPMEEDLVYSEKDGNCPRCGMKLRPMDDANRNKMTELLAGREIIHVLNPENVEIEAVDEYYSFTEKPLIIIGEGAITHACPMDEDLVYSAGENNCPRCNMKLKPISDESKSKLEELMESREIIRIKSPDDIRIEIRSK